MTSGAAEGLFVFAACWLLAKVEIEIEGARGWAEGLPTWRWSPPWLLKLTNGKPVTGYHLWLTCFLVAAFHWPLVWTGWSPAGEARALSAYLMTTVTWDFQWFVWNPAWGKKRFFSERVWWFPTRVLGLPVEYYLAYAAAGAVVFLSGDRTLIARWPAEAGALAAASAAAALAAPR